MTRMNQDTVVKIVDHQISADLSGATVVLQLKEGVYYQLNEVGAQVWKQLGEGPRAVRELVRAITDEYEIDQSRCEADVVALLEDMSDRGLVAVADPES